MLSLGVIMLFIWQLCLMCQVIVFRFFWIFDSNFKFPTVILTIIFLFGIMFNFLPWLHRPMRWEICKTICHILIAPFGKVYFRTFFLADIITSIKIMLYDSTAMVCFYSSGEFLSEIPESCVWQNPMEYAWAILPYWWRFWQCIRRWYDDRSNTNQLWNAFKYFWGIMAGVMAMMYKIEGRYRAD